MKKTTNAQKIKEPQENFHLKQNGGENDKLRLLDRKTSVLRILISCLFPVFILLIVDACNICPSTLKGRV